MEIFYRFGNFLPLPSIGTFLKRHEERAAVSRPEGETTRGTQGTQRGARNEAPRGRKGQAERKEYIPLPPKSCE